MERVQEIVGDKKTVMSVLVTTYGLKRNEYASRFDRTVTMEDLFQKKHHGTSSKDSFFLFLDRFKSIGTLKSFLQTAYQCSRTECRR